MRVESPLLHLSLCDDFPNRVLSCCLAQEALYQYSVTTWRGGMRGGGGGTSSGGDYMYAAAAAGFTSAVRLCDPMDGSHS